MRREAISDVRVQYQNKNNEKGDCDKGRDRLVGTNKLVLFYKMIRIDIEQRCKTTNIYGVIIMLVIYMVNLPEWADVFSIN